MSSLQVSAGKLQAGFLERHPGRSSGGSRSRARVGGHRGGGHRAAGPVAGSAHSLLLRIVLWTTYLIP